MEFLNASLHPKAHALANHILLAATKHDKHSSTFYNPLIFWQQAQDMTDDKTADLYARIEEAFIPGSYFTVSHGERVSKISKALWGNDLAVPR